MAWATKQVSLFFGSFRKADADDPEVFTAGCLRLFTAYPPEIVQHVTDPLTGLCTQSEWLPSLKRVKDALSERHETVAARKAVQDRELEQIAARKAELANKNNRPTLEELKAKHGPNWGLQADVKAEDVARAERRRDLQIEANRTLFAEECKAAGMPEDSPVSPSLIALIKAGMA